MWRKALQALCVALFLLAVSVLLSTGCQPVASVPETSPAASPEASPGASPTGMVGLLF
ncbi:MAG: hypothetical protein N2205_06890 [Candidatus Caldatribacterium sp.]|uniref:hypothetical protein n=1 Tax=Candidatus Caldatribacterium sp. TaxID=2282143 RepID=UPI002999214D|nr:hypothetical protein [Candidatus Caldatribacterium sp.]MCX7730921.1 hypothetical protein [Candidatus Caldatribacterium sp.]MDW8081460.1 hypothetical protein [Candidatus Calescibacterium sp.]